MTTTGGYVQTVSGRVGPSALGITLAHEHLVSDLRGLYSPPPAAYAYLAEAEITPALIPLVRQASQCSLPNLVLSGDQATLHDLICFRAEGGGALVEVTCSGIGQDPVRLRALSAASGVHVIAGCGYYRHRVQPPEVLALDSGAIAAEVERAIQVGIAGTDVRAGIIGEVGSSEPLHPFERASLVGAALAQRQTGAAISVHPDIWGRGHLEVLTILEDAGADLSRTIMGHMDEVSDRKWQRQVAERGVYLAFDTFGSELEYDGVSEPSDSQRIDCLLALLEAGYGDRLLLSQDVCYKIHLTAYGGHGYAHVLRDIVPELRRRGAGNGELCKMLVDNPARVLALHA